MGNEALSDLGVAEPASFNEVLWTELSVLRPGATTGDGASASSASAPRLENLYQTIAALEQQSEPLSAICLSGSGIRSATFNLGVLQQLARLGVLRDFDYVSSVSGGGYIAGWLQAWMYHEPQALSQLKNFVAPGAFEAEPQPVRNLRAYSNYLAPKLGLFSPETWSAAVKIARNVLLNWLVILSALAAATAITWWFVACMENNQLVAAFDSLFLVFAVLMQLATSILVFRARRYSGILPYEQAGFVAVCVVPIALTAVMLCVAALGLKRWIIPGLTHSASDLVALWAFAATWCVVIPLIGWAVIEAGLLAPRQPTMTVTPSHHEIRRARRLPELWSLIGSGAITAALLAIVILHYLPALYASIGAYIVFAAPMLLAIDVFARTAFVELAAYAGNVTDADREWWERLSGWVVLVAISWIVVTAVCLFAPLSTTWILTHIEATDLLSKAAPAVFAAVGGISGIVAAILGSRDGTTSSDAAPNGSLTRKIALRIAAPLFAVVVIAMVVLGTVELAFYVSVVAERFVDSLGYRRYPSSLGELTPFAFLFLLVLLGVYAYILGRLVDVNRFSLHGFHRSRLIRAYLGASRADRIADPFSGSSPGDDIPLAGLRQPVQARHKLLPIINATLNLVHGGEKLGWQQRKAESFAMTPYFCGNHLQGYRSTNRYGGAAGMSLGTAMSISGTGASPSTGYNASPLVSFMMALFNTRLGAWLGNTNPHGAVTYRHSAPRLALWPLFAELCGLTTDTGKYINLSDGGHFDNLGLYEVVLRRCREIFVSDASCDARGTFEELGNAIRKIRIDLGISIDFTRQIEIRGGGKNKPGLYCALAVIRYIDVDGPGVPNGVLIYLKATTHGRGAPLPYDVYSYAKAFQAFPHQAIEEQRLTESQFESYRALGRHSVAQVFGDGPVMNLREFVDRAQHYAAGPRIRKELPSV